MSNKDLSEHQQCSCMISCSAGNQVGWGTEQINRMEMWFSLDCFAWFIWFGADLYGPMTVFKKNISARNYCVHD